MIRILFVDDCRDDADVAVRTLRRAGVAFEHRVVMNLAEAATALRDEPWSMVISDYSLGGATALDVLRVVRDLAADLPFIVLSGTIDEERAVGAMREGADDYVRKDRLERLPSAVRRELASFDSRQSQRRLEARLRRAEELYRTTFEEAPVAIANADASFRMVSVNARFCSLLGCRAEAVIGRDVAELLHPDERDDARAIMRQLTDGSRDSIEVERRCRRADGRTIWISAKVSVVRDAAGALEYAIAHLEDVTAQREARERLLLHARMLECVEQAVLATDLEGRVIFWNAFAETLYGWPASEALGRNVLDLTPAVETREEAAAIFEKLQRGESWSGEIVLRRRDGSTFPAWVTDSPIVDADGRMAGVVGVSFDLTAQKRAVNELAEQRGQLALAQEIASIGSWTYDAATGERHWSEGFTRIFGIEPDATLEDVLPLIHPDDRERVVQLIAAAHASAEPFATEFRIRRADGERTILTRYRFIEGEQHQRIGAIGVAKDVTEFREVHEELHRRALQHAAVANLGQIALSGASTAFLFQQALGAAGAVHDFERRAVLRHTPEGFVLVEGVGYPENALGSRIDFGPDSQVALTLRTSAAVMMNDARTETRFIPAPAFVEQGFLSAITVPIYSSDGSTWGVLAAHSRTARTYSPQDVDVLRAIASIVGQALDRSAADAELRTRARQQSAIAQLGGLVLTSVTADVFHRACELLQIGTGADYAFFNEITVAGTMRRVAGTVWSSELPIEIPIVPTAQAGQTILSGTATVVDDYRTDDRFATRDSTVPFGILSGVMVPVASAGHTYGVLSVQSRNQRHFTPSDVDFLHAIANILAEATERELARAVIEESESRYRRIYDGAKEIIFTVSRDGKFVSLNPSFAEITGWSREEWLGRPYIDLLAPHKREANLSEFREMLENGVAKTAETTLVGRHGLVEVEVTSFCKLEDGRVAEIYGFARDITEARRTAAEREEVTRSLELLLESTIEGIYTLDLEGRCTMVNRAAAAFVGYEPAELLGATWHTLIHGHMVGGGFESCAVGQVLLTGEPCSVNSDVFVRKDGSVFPVSYSAAPIVDRGVRVGVVVSFIDLTEQRQLEAKLEQANRLSSLGRLAAIVAHEFNNVLMGISPFVELVRRSRDPEKINSSLDYIANGVKRGRRITQDILRFTQPADPVLAPVDLNGWLAALGGEARSVLTSQYDVTVVSERLMVDADANQLHQIFLNLILNARDAMPSGGSIRISARRDHDDARYLFGAVERPSRFAHITVSDTGCGMKEETLHHAFEPLFTTKKNGTGLGLAVAHQVVRRHGGDIFIESKVDEGTTFHIFLPLRESAEVAVVDAAGEVPHAAPRRRILLVEDDAAVALGLSALLDIEGFAVDHVGNGGDAVDAFRRAPHDAVLLDVGLPDTDGRRVYLEIANMKPKVPVVFSTGHADRGELEELLGRPNVACLLKPYEGDALLDALAKVMAAA